MSVGKSAVQRDGECRVHRGLIRSFQSINLCVLRGKSLLLGRLGIDEGFVFSGGAEPGSLPDGCGILRPDDMTEAVRTAQKLPGRAADAFRRSAQFRRAADAFDRPVQTGSALPVLSPVFLKFLAGLGFKPGCV